VAGDLDALPGGEVRVGLALELLDLLLQLGDGEGDFGGVLESLAPARFLKFFARLEEGLFEFEGLFHEEERGG
jgi:hypothetical protein